MKASVATSAVLHSVVLAWALLSLSAPTSFEVADVEALPVDIVPIEELTQVQQGDKSAPVREKAAPVPTKRPDIVANAENVGDNDVDLKNPPTPEKRPPTEVAAAPEKVDKVLPVKSDENNDVKDIAKEETITAPPKEIAPKPEPAKEPTPAPKPEPVKEPTPAPEPVPTPTPEPAEQAKPEEAPLPTAVPLPASRPQPPKPPEPKPQEAKPAEAKPVEQAKAETPKTPDRKVGDKNQEIAKAKSSKESDFNADQIASLLNKQQAAGGGAKRATEQAALGGKKTTAGSSLSQSEMDALRGQIQNNWSIIPGMADATGVRIQVKFRLDENGAIIGEPEVSATGGSAQAQQVLAGGARRAVLKSSPFKNLPRDKYDAWAEVIVNFDPSELL